MVYLKNLITIQNGMRVKNTEGACNYFYSDYYLAHNDENNLRWEVIKGFSLNN